MFERHSVTQRWSVVLLGALLCGIVAGGAIITQQQVTAYHLLQFSVPFGLSLVVAAVGAWLVRSDLSAEQVSRIALWSVGGAIVVSSFALWEMYLHTLEGETVVEALHEPLLGMAEGAAVGTLLGYYDSRRLAQEQETREAHEAISASVDGIAVLDEDERYTTVNQAHAEVYGYDDPDEFIGESWRMCYTDTERERVEDEVFEALGESGYWRGELTGVRRNGEPFPQEVSLSMMEDGGLVCVVRDISDQKRRTRELEAAQGRFQALTDNAGFGVITIDETSTIRYANGALEDVLGYPPEDVVGESLTMLMPDRFRDEHLSGIQQYLDDGDRTLDWEWLELPGQHSDGHEVPLGISFGETVLEDGHLFTGILRDITTQTEQEEQIAALHDASRRLTEATTPDEVASVTVDIANNVLGKPFSTMLFYDEEDGQLDTAASADSTAAFLEEAEVGELSGISTGQLGMEVFRSGEMRVIDEYETVDNRAFPDLPLGTVVIVPVGGYGILALGCQSIEAVTETERHQIELLALNARAALERAEREADLQRQTDEMEFFNSILRHDVLNGMTVIRGRAEFLTDELEGDQLRDAETIVDWSNDIVTIIQRVRTVLETLTGLEDPHLEPTELSGALRSEISRVQTTYPDVTFETAIPEGVTVQANELLGEVLGNVITNAVDHNDTDGLRISITVDDPDESHDHVTVRIADNGRGVPDDSKEAIFRRDETGHAKSTGSGFGLFFVDSMVAEYGGDIRVADTDTGGAEFVIELPTP